jgi:hypothetical protein
MLVVALPADALQRLTLISEALDKIEERGIVKSRRRSSRPEPEMPLLD